MSAVGDPPMSTIEQHRHDLDAFAHSHAFADDGQRQRERALSAVTALTLATMVVELLVGSKG